MKHERSIWGLLLAFALVCGCTESRVASETTAIEIGPAGGVATSADGLAELDLPKDALSENKTITIEIVRDDARAALLSPVYRFTPADLPLAVAARLSLSLDQPSGKLTLADVTATSPMPLAGVQGDGTDGDLTAAIKKLGSFAAVASTAVYDPCAGKSCGAECSLCPPGSTDCNEDTVVKACDPNGACVAKTPGMCGGYNSCAGKSCGASCTICPPASTDCNETTVEKACNAKGECVADTGDLCNDVYDPCAGKSCGDNCTICPPGSTDCNETGVIKVCNAQGQCVADTGDLCNDVYDPCAGKSCGDNCTICPPGDSNCNEDAVIKSCDPQGNCVAAVFGMCAPCDPNKLPQCIIELIAQMESEPVANPPASLTQYEYNGQCTYYLPPRCCDIPSVLYDSTCNVICAPDGGLSGGGDGKCTDFFTKAAKGQTVWQDPRSYP